MRPALFFSDFFGEVFPRAGDPEKCGTDIGIAAVRGEFLRLTRMPEITLAPFLRRFFSHPEPKPLLWRFIDNPGRTDWFQGGR